MSTPFPSASSYFSETGIGEYSLPIYSSSSSSVVSDDYADYACTGRHPYSCFSMSESTNNRNSRSGRRGPRTLLKATVKKKPPRPTLDAPFNLSAYTKPTHYKSYIDEVLAPSTHVARSTITAVTEDQTEALSEANIKRFNDLITHEMDYQYDRLDKSWVRDSVFNVNGYLKENFDRIITHSKMWSREGCLVDPLPSFVEREMVDWLNRTVEKLHEIVTPQLLEPQRKEFTAPRFWSDRTANPSPAVGSQDRKSDVGLYHDSLEPQFRDKNYKPSWEMIKAFAELTRTPNKFPDMLRNILEKAYLIFETQPFREFVIALVFTGAEESAKWHLVRVDRSGVKSSNAMDLTGFGGLTLLRALYYLCVAPPRFIGIDETMEICELTGLVTHISVTGPTPTDTPATPPTTLKFKVVRLIHAPSQISGRATRVWIVSLDLEFYVLKDSWPRDSIPFSEIVHLLKIHKTIQSDKRMREILERSYPVFVIGQEFSDSNTHIIREGFPLYRYDVEQETRVHRRIVTKPVGDPLTSFRSKLELCNVLCDVVTYLKYCTEKCRICHSDISLDNVTIHRPLGDEGDVSKGTKGIGNSRTSSNDANSNIFPKSADLKGASASNSKPTPHLNSGAACSSISLADPTAVSSSTSLADPTTVFGSKDYVPQPISAHGLVIDYDNAFSLDEAAEKGYRMNSGTLPYMALDSLKWEKPEDFTHQPQHDLESLFYVILTLCTYVERPGHLRSRTPLPEDKSICMNQWWAIGDYHDLARSKALALSSFESFTLRSIPSYWDDFRPVLQKLHDAIWPLGCTVNDQPNMATHDEFFRILDEARKMYRTKNEEPLEYAPIANQPATSKRKIGATASNDVKRRKNSTRPAAQPSTRKRRSNSKHTSNSRLADAT